MTLPIIMMPDTEGKLNIIGDPIRSNNFYGFSDGLHTISIHTQNFKGRVFLEASLELTPTDSSWFPIWLSETLEYIEFPQNPSNPTGENGGDTSSISFSFKINCLWFRARIDRDYLPDPKQTIEQIRLLGSIKKIMLGR